MNLSKKRSILILLWHPEPPYSGGSFNAHQMSFQYLGKDAKWLILDKEDSKFEEIKNPNISFHAYGTPKLIRKITRKVFVAGRLLEWLYLPFVIFRKSAKLIREENVDTIYLPIAELYQITLVARVLKKVYKVKVVTIVHQFDNPQELGNLRQHTNKLMANGVSRANALAEVLVVRSLYKAFVSSVRRFTAAGVISQYMKKRLKNEMGVDAKYLKYGFDLETYRSVQVHNKLYDAVFLGRFVYFKGINDLIEVWEEVVRTRSDAKLLLLGDGETEFVESIKASIKEKGLENNIILRGFVFGEEKVRLLKQSRVFLFLSHSESYAQVVDEAIACSLPVVAYDLEPYRSREEYTDFMYLYPLGDHKSVVVKLQELLNAPKSTDYQMKTEFLSWKEFAEQEQKFVLGPYG